MPIPTFPGGEPAHSVYREHYYSSFLTDPDGNNVEAVWSARANA